MKLDELRSRRPIDIIAKTNPILIIDEPQSVEGNQTKERLKEFKPLLTLRCSATHKADSREAVIGILDAVYDSRAMQPENARDQKVELQVDPEKLAIPESKALWQHITYNMLEERYDTDIFTEPTIKGRLGANLMKAQHHLYDHIVYDSTNERDFASTLDTNTDVAVYVNLPDSYETLLNKVMK